MVRIFIVGWIIFKVGEFFVVFVVYWFFLCRFGGVWGIGVWGFCFIIFLFKGKIERGIGGFFWIIIICFIFDNFVFNWIVVVVYVCLFIWG